MNPPRRANNFDALRLLFAGLVFVFHLVVLSGAPVAVGVVPTLARGAQVAIQGFFIISGYLVYASFRRSTGLADYAEKRARRLLPAYAAVVVGAAAVAVTLVPEARTDPSAVGRYLGANLIFLNFLAPTLPGVFESNPLPEVNGALWTLKVEVMFYAVVPLLAWSLRRWSGWRLATALAALYVAGEAWRIGVTWHVAGGAVGLWPRLPHQLPGQLAFFVSGIALLEFRARLLSRPALLVAVSAAATVLSLAPPFLWLRAAGLAGLILWMALAAPVHLPAARFGDLSYGLYILHCPIIQTLVAAGWLTTLAWPQIAGATALVLGAASALWWGIERPALRRDSHYRRADSPHGESRRLPDR